MDSGPGGRSSVLVTGGAGFIGSHTVDRLLAAGHRVTVLDDLSSGRRENLPAEGTNFQFLHGSILDPQSRAQAMAGCDAVAHLAAVSSVVSCSADVLAAHRTNVEGTIALIEHARGAGVKRFVFASSAAVYGDASAMPVGEDQPAQPISSYGADKLACEHYLRVLGGNNDIETTVFRFFNVYGSRQPDNSPYSGVVSVFMRRARERARMTVFGDGRQTRDFVSVADIADLLARTLTGTGPAAGTYNVGTGRETTLLHLAKTIGALFGSASAPEFLPRRDGDILRSVADVARLDAAFGWIPSTPIEEGLAAMISLQHSRSSERQP